MCGHHQKNFETCARPSKKLPIYLQNFRWNKENLNFSMELRKTFESLTKLSKDYRCIWDFWGRWKKPRTSKLKSSNSQRANSRLKKQTKARFYLIYQLKTSLSSLPITLDHLCSIVTWFCVFSVLLRSEYLEHFFQKIGKFWIKVSVFSQFIWDYGFLTVFICSFVFF